MNLLRIFNIRLDEMSTSKWMITNQAPLIIEDTTNSKIWTVFPEVEWIEILHGITHLCSWKTGSDCANLLQALKKIFIKIFRLSNYSLFT